MSLDHRLRGLADPEFSMPYNLQDFVMPYHRTDAQISAAVDAAYDRLPELKEHLDKLSQAQRISPELKKMRFGPGETAELQETRRRLREQIEF